MSGCEISSGSNTRAWANGIRYFNNSSSSTNVIKINGNIFTEPGQYGIYLASAQGGNSATVAAQRGQIFNNIIMIDASSYSQVRGIYTNSSYSGYFDIMHNTVILDGTNQDNTSACIYFGGDYTSIMNNNLVYRASSGAAVPLVNPVAPTGLQVDYNNYYNSAGSTLLQIGGTYTANTFKGGGGYNANSFNVAPNFVSNSNPRLDAKVSFPSGKTGTGITVDIDGDKRCLFAPTIGADQSEYSPKGKPAFVGNATAYINSPTTFLNKMDKVEPLEYTWSVDGKVVQKSFDFTYTFPANGTYDVTLTSITCDGNDEDSTVSITVSSPTLAPIADFTLGKSVVETDEEVGIQDVSLNGPSKWEYLVTPATYFNPISGQTEPTFFFTEGDVDEPTGKLIFRTPGKYEICLIAENSIGKDTTCKKDIIEVVIADRLCSFNSASDETKGVLYDDGGNGSYSANRNCDYLINPCGGEVVLDFALLNLADGDYLRIYDGIDNNGEPIWDKANFPNGLNGDLTGTGLKLRAKSGKAFVEFESDNSNFTVASGFKINWSVDPKAFAPPVADFTVSDTICVDVVTYMINESEGDYNTYEWWIDGQLAGNEADVHDEAFLFAGTYEVKLKAYNCGGVDSMSRFVTVAAQSKLARAAFSTNNPTPNVGEEVDLLNTTSYCFDKASWTISPNTFSYVNGTDANSINPRVAFTQPGCYEVKLEVTNKSGSTDITKSCFFEVGKYCVPATNILSSDLGIVRFSIDDIDRSSDADQAGYTSYVTTDEATLVKGATYSFTLERGGQNNNFSGNVWIDLDGDGTFASSELLARGTNLQGNKWMDSVKIPISASSITTRMRVQTSSAVASASTCGPNVTGEYEDYKVTLLVDNEAPVITLIGSSTINIEEGRGFTDPGATAFDNQSGDITSDIVVAGTVDTLKAATYQLTYDVQDEAGNKATTVTRTVVVTADTTKPVVTLIGDAHDTIYVGDSYTDPGAEAEDILDGDLTANIQLTDNLDNSAIGTYTFTYSVTDSRNNTGTAERLVSVLDTTNPVLALVGSDTVQHEVLTTYTDLGYTLSDNHDDSATVVVEVNTNLDIETPGVYKYTMCAIDQSQNQGCVTRFVEVDDRTAPVLVRRGDSSITHEVNTPFNDPWVQVNDNFSRNVSLTTGGSFDGTPDELGTFTIWYYAEDEAGNKDSLARELVIVDTTAPMISLNGDEEVQVERWEDFVDPGVAVQDNYDDEVDVTITTDGDYDNSQSAGRYFITYQAVDQTGNESVVLTRIVDVVYTATSVEMAGDVEMNLFPNPTSNQFTLQAQFADKQDVQIEVRDITGRVVYQSAVQHTAVLNENLSVNTWNPGSYLVIVRTNNGQSLERLSVVR